MFEILRLVVCWYHSQVVLRGGAPDIHIHEWVVRILAEVDGAAVYDAVHKRVAARPTASLSGSACHRIKANLL